MTDLKFFFNISKDVAMTTNFVWYRTCSLGAKVSQDPLDRFSQSLQHMVVIELQMITSFYFSDILRDVAMATNLVAKMGQNYLHPALIALSIQNGMGYRDFNVYINSTNDASISCKKFRELWSSNSRENGAHLYTFFYDMAKKLAYLVKYLRI